MLRQGVLPETTSFVGATAFQEKMHGRELPEVAWQRTNARDASTCADPGVAVTRAAQHDKPEIFLQPETLAMLTNRRTKGKIRYSWQLATGQTPQSKSNTGGSKAVEVK